MYAREYESVPRAALFVETIFRPVSYVMLAKNRSGGDPMTKTRLFQALWILLLAVVCALMFFWRRESTKSAQGTIPFEDTVVAVVTPDSTPAPLPTVPPTLQVVEELVPTPKPTQKLIEEVVPTPKPTIFEITEVFVPLIETPTPAPLPTAPFSISTPIPSPSPVPDPDSIAPFSLIWFSDTQYYAYKKPEIFLSMADWALRVRTDYNALAVVCTGDIVDNRNYTRHWTNAEKAIDRVRESMPFYCVAGNHDVGADKVDYTQYFAYDFCTAPEAMEFSEDGRCWVLPIYSHGILLIGIGWQNDVAYADWLNGRIHAYNDLPAVLLVHSFLNDDGSLSVNGKRVEKAILRRSPSVRLVLCGHNDGSARWSKTYDDGHTVNAMMYNFQDDKKYGLGYARVLMFNPKTRNIAVTTYSPYLNDYNYYKNAERDTFTLHDAW